MLFTYCFSIILKPSSKGFDKETFNHFWSLANTSQSRTGIMIIDGFEYWEQFQDFSDLWYMTLCPEVKLLEISVKSHD
jgi:hypothetical protein